jgi:hypothetical protein
MTYSKPEVIEMGDAGVLIQGLREQTQEENSPTDFTQPSYEVDE